jgi:hypothetical protein
MSEQRKIAIVGGCECGIGYINIPDSIDSGATFRCEAGHPIVFDVASPTARAELFSKKEVAVLRAKLEKAEVEIERLQKELLLIGDMAVVNFDDVVVRKIDAAVPQPPATYAEWRRAELAQVGLLKAEIERLQQAERAWELAVSYPEMQLRLVSISHAGWRALKDALETKL